MVKEEGERRVLSSSDHCSDRELIIVALLLPAIMTELYMTYRGRGGSITVAYAQIAHG